MRLGVYCDFSYRAADGAVSADVAFSRFVEGLAPHCERVVAIGRLDPGAIPFPYPLRAVEFVGLPHYRSGADLAAVLRAVPESLRRFRRALDGLDVVWILGPNPPQAILFALAARLRGRRVVLGVRQNLPLLIRYRRPDQPIVILAAHVLDTAFRLLARRIPVVVVGSDLARRYRRSRSMLSIYVSLLGRERLSAAGAAGRAYDGPELTMLSVGRLDPEKNPLLLVDVLARAAAIDPRWRLVVCGDGPLFDALGARARELGVADRLQRVGHVPVDGPLWDRYRSAHVLLHVSLTEGVPQVLLEALAARLPVVATEVGGVGELVDGCGLLVPARDADAAARALTRMVTDAGLRDVCVEAGARRVADHTLDAECARLSAFLAGR